MTAKQFDTVLRNLHVGLFPKIQKRGIEFLVNAVLITLSISFNKSYVPISVEAKSR